MITASMPYGEVKIETKEQALHFIKHRCDDCDHNNEYMPCSGNYSSKCDAQVTKVMTYYAREKERERNLQMDDKLNEIYDYHFKNHKAKLIQDTDRYFIVDWQNADGGNTNYVNYIVDKLRGNIIISGDLGDCVATWYNPLKPVQIKNFISGNVDYFISKFQCSSDKYDYSEENVLNDLRKHIESVCDQSDFEEFFADNDFGICDEEDLWDEIENEIESCVNGNSFTPNERLENIVSEFDSDCWEWLHACGRRVHLRVRLWAEGFYRALEQLGI